MNSTQLEVAYCTERGRRSQNEDMLGIPAPFVSYPLGERGFVIEGNTVEKGFLFALADGVGGCDDGERASAFAIAEAARRYYADPSADLAHSLRRVIEATHRTLRRKQLDAQLATTFTAAVVCDDQMILANVGDSRAYLWRKGEWVQLTCDHNRATQREAHGMDGDDRNRLTRGIGHGCAIGVDIWSYRLQVGDCVLLCSDGLLRSGDDLSTLSDGLPLQSWLISLVDTAYDNGSSDNISGIALSILGDSQEA